MIALCLSAAVVATVATGCRALDRERYHSLLEANTHVDATYVDVPMTCTASTDGGATESGCHLVTVPPRQAAAQDLGADAGVLVFAVRTVTFGFGTNQWQSIGFDRDGYCTHNPSQTGQGCRPLAGVPQPVEDGEGGRDNALGSNLGPLFTGVMFNEADVNNGVAAGDRTLGVRIRSFGGPNDAQVNMEWFPLMHGRGGDGGATLQWDGTDIWSIDSRLAYDPASPGTVLIRSNAGYTTCGTLVARLPARVPIRMAGTHRQVRLTLSNAVVTGPLDPLGHSFGPLDFSAYWNLSDALTDLGVLGLCPPTGDGGGSPNWDLVSSILMSAADLLSTGESSPAVECDALSAAFRMEFSPIVLGADESSPAVPEDLCGR